MNTEKLLKNIQDDIDYCRNIEKQIFVNLYRPELKTEAEAIDDYFYEREELDLCLEY